MRRRSYLRGAVLSTSLALLAHGTALAQDCSGTTFLASAVVVSGLALYDIGTAPASARKYNRDHLVVVPHLDPVRGAYGFRATLPLGRSRRSVHSVSPSRRSPGTAFALSLGLTAIPVGAGLAIGNDTGGWMFLSGVVIGPSMGHFYAGQPGRALGTTALRAAGTLIGIASIIDCFAD